jgi:hypothetical protein
MLLLAAAVMVSGCSSSVTATDWALAAPPGDGEVTVVVKVGSSSCDSLESLEVAEDESSVQITASVRHTRRLGLGCTNDLNVETVAVPLDTPLGTRMLTGCALGADAYFNHGDGTRRASCSEVVEGYSYDS